MRHDKPSADRRARRLAHGNAVGKCINIPSAVGATLIPLDYRTKLWALWLAFAAKRRSCRMRSAGWTTTLIVDTTAVDMVVVGCRSGNQNQLIPMDGKSFSWQRGFAAFSVSASNKDAVVRKQDTHHKKMDFKSEIDCSIGETRRALRPEICF